ncbi:peptidoglycan recognition protein family protein [Aureispira anguillae]|uniref:N-acetylmuramoyl-L-alanine amidase n=1 Tax=Aureispira anguillae TaxID=2864201 RepID=A0A916DU99_9BACT|nr:peptidoglycan recognition family protein [Aureispira anguillae]BDS12355.1 N-acetylmuramoyl-L-alanine amidase [Aureispira anguillae]
MKKAKFTFNQKLGWGGLGFFLLLLVIWFKSQSIKIIDKSNHLMRSSTKQYATRTLDVITQIIVHHSASIGQIAEDYARYHVLSKGWAAIAYHFIIEKDGTIIQGNPLTNISNHTAGQNTKSIGICLSGNFNLEQPSPKQLKSLKKLIHHLRNQLPQALAVYGHKDHGSTSCPGTNLYQQLNQYQLA